VTSTIRHQYQTYQRIDIRPSDSRPAIFGLTSSMTSQWAVILAK
jgi:hypothetical protein